jgi:hypothetical protein
MRRRLSYIFGPYQIVQMGYKPHCQIKKIDRSQIENKIVG